MTLALTTDKPMFQAQDGTYNHKHVTVQLRPTKYLRRFAAAQIEDDGIVDDTAIERFASGDRSVRLSPREVVCVVAHLAAEGVSDNRIAALFGLHEDPDADGTDWVKKIRNRHCIAASSAVAQLGAVA